MQTLFLAACPFCALARIVADIFCHSEQRVLSQSLMLEFNSFCSAAITLAGIEIMHMIRKGQ